MPAYLLPLTGFLPAAAVHALALAGVVWPSVESNRVILIALWVYAFLLSVPAWLQAAIRHGHDAGSVELGAALWHCWDVLDALPLVVRAWCWAFVIYVCAGGAFLVSRMDTNEFSLLHDEITPVIAALGSLFPMVVFFFDGLVLADTEEVRELSSKTTARFRKLFRR